MPLLHKILLLVCLILFSVSCFASTITYATGDELATAVYNREDGDNVLSIGNMQLIEKGHTPRIRQMIIFSEERDGIQSSSLIRFKKPADIKNTGLLTISYDDENKDTDQWIYLPAIARARRISSRRKGGHFVGSDIFYEDLRDRKVAKDKHTIIGNEEINGLKTIILESIPIDLDDSAYSKKVSWIAPKTLLPLKIEFYQNGESLPFKQTLVKKIKKIQGIWSIMESVVKDLKSLHETHLQVTSIFYNQNIPSHLFSRKFLSDPSREIKIMRAISQK